MPTRTRPAPRSQDWWSLGSTLRTTGSVYDYYFGFLQKDSDFYNRYAETIYPFTDAYGFAYSDRITDGRAAISWNAQAPTPIDTVENGKRVSVSSGGAASASEKTGGLAGMGDGA